MEDVLKADIFFFVTTIAVVVLSVLMAFALYYLVQILRRVRDIAELARTEADQLKDDFEDLREDVHEGMAHAKTYARALTGAMSAQNLITHLMDFIAQARKRPRRTRKKRAKDE